MARPPAIGRRYAEAAFELASRDDAVDAWAAGLDLAAALIADQRIEQRLDDPSRSLKERQTLVQQLLGDRVPAGVLNLVRLLTERGRADRVAAVAAEFRRLLRRQRGVVEAVVTSATPLDAAETKALQKRIAEIAGGKTELEIKVDAALIGGLTVRIGDNLIDASVRGRLERLRSQLVAGSRPAAGS
ncbi:MAG TPA: ATP synthase F1 subunit delta [Candidatus Eisenbacteria bacterium]|nr:ATP synthase F1 subunit delta [Candidatus Eisenbacteria bacterium]